MKVSITSLFLLLAAAHAEQGGRILELTENGCTAGDDCCAGGSDPCLGAGLNGEASVALGACIGDYTCRHAGRDDTGSFTVGTNSCDGTKACEHAGRKVPATVGAESCKGLLACGQLGREGTGAVGDGSCVGSTKPCNVLGRFAGATGTVGNGSCLGDFAW